MKFRLTLLLSCLLLSSFLPTQAQITFSKQAGALGYQYKTDPWVPIASGAVPTSLISAITANATSITAIQTARLENKNRLSDFLKAIIDYLAAPAGKVIPVGWYGDSVSPHVSNEFIRQLFNSLPSGGQMAPAVGNSLGGMPMITTGVVPYNLYTSVADQTTNTGVVTPVSITRSGSTATITLASTRAVVGGYVTVSGASQSEYNGIFPITAATGTSVAYTVPGTPASPATGTISVYGTQVDFTYLPNGLHTELATGATLLVQPSFTLGQKTFKTYLATGPGMGTAKIDLLDGSTSTVLSTTTVNLSAGALSAAKVSFPLSATVSYNLRITSTTGKVVHLLSIMSPDNGIIPLSFGIGGSTFTQQQSSSDAIFSYLMADLGVKLLFVQAKEEGLPGSLTPLASRLNSLTGVSKLVVGSLPDNTSAALQLANNTYFHDWAIANNWAYFDGYNVFGSYAELVRLGFQGDGTHPAQGANVIAANSLITETGVTSLFNSVERRSIDHSYTTNSVTTSKLAITGWTPGVAAVDILTPSGGGQPGYGILSNLLRVGFGPLSTGQYLAGYGTYGVSVQWPGFGGGLMQAGWFEATQTNPGFASTLQTVAVLGKLSYGATLTAAGTTGNQTINTPSGTVNMAAGSASLVVTNSLVSSSSIVTCVIRSNDATASIKNVVPNGGTFTINLTGNATAETSIGFIVNN